MQPPYHGMFHKTPLASDTHLIKEQLLQRKVASMDPEARWEPESEPTPEAEVLERIRDYEELTRQRILALPPTPTAAELTMDYLISQALPSENNVRAKFNDLVSRESTHLIWFYLWENNQKNPINLNMTNIELWRLPAPPDESFSRIIFAHKDHILPRGIQQLDTCKDLTYAFLCTIWPPYVPDVTPPRNGRRRSQWKFTLRRSDFLN